MEKKMKKNRLTLADILLAVVFFGIFAVIVISQFVNTTPENWRFIPPGLETDFTVGLMPALPDYKEEAFLAYRAQNRRNYGIVQFRDVGLDGNLDEVRCSSGAQEFIFDPNSEYPEGESWTDWLRDFEIVRREVATGLKPGAEKIIQAQNTREEKKK